MVSECLDSTRFCLKLVCMSSHWCSNGVSGGCCFVTCENLGKGINSEILSSVAAR
jgi:hypothetical protein